MTNIVILAVSLLTTNVLQRMSADNHGCWNTQCVWTLTLKFYAPTGGVFAVEHRYQAQDPMNVNYVCYGESWHTFNERYTNGAGTNSILVPVPYQQQSVYRMRRL